MSGLSRHNLQRSLLLCGLIGAVCSGLGAIWFLRELAEGNHSNEGSILLVGSGLLLLISVLIVAIGAIYWKTRIPGRIIRTLPHHAASIDPLSQSKPHKTKKKKNLFIPSGTP